MRKQAHGRQAALKATSGDAGPSCKGRTPECGPCLSTWLVLRTGPKVGVGKFGEYVGQMRGVPIPSHGAWPETLGGVWEQKESRLRGVGSPLQGRPWVKGGVWVSSRSHQFPGPPTRAGGDGAHTHLVPDALTLTGALGVHPQVRAELVGANAWMAPRPLGQAGPQG